MLDVLTAADVRRQDAACEALGISVDDLMERAGFGVARAVRELMGVSYGLRAVVVCGKGNNAGDGLVAGRWLRSWGAHATAVMTLGRDLTGAAGRALGAFDGPVRDETALDRELERADVVVDAIFGVGLSRAPEGAAARAVDAMNRGGAPVVSVDVPSGLNADSGTAPGVAVRPTVIVTLGGLKPGLLFSAEEVAWTEVVDIGVPDPERTGTALAMEAEDVRQVIPLRAAGTNKRRSGVVLAVAGSRAMPGAAALVCGAVVHAGAGLTTLAAPESVTHVALARTPEMTTIPLPETAEGTLGEKGVEAILARIDEFDALALGPGLSRHPATAEAVRALCSATTLPLVLDADGLGAFAGDLGALRARRGPVVLTPHEGELARLMGVTAEDIRADRLAAARRAAEEAGHLVVLKGPGTVIAEPAGKTFLNVTGNRGLAQGGTGDVLTGILASLLAQSRAPDVATVAAGVWLHGRAADVAAERCAPHPANASMLIELLADVVHEVFS